MGRSEEEEALISTGVYAYERPPRDRPWAIAYLVLLGLTFAGGIYGLAHRNPDFTRVFEDQNYLADPQNCPYNPGNQLNDVEPEDFDWPKFFRQAAIWLGVSVVVSFLMGLAFIQLIRHHAGPVMRLTIASQIAAPLVGAAAALAAHQFGGAVFLLIMAGLAAIVFWLWRREVDLCARLLGVAAAGLNANTGLLAFVAAAKLAMLVVIAPIAVGEAAAFTNGHPVPNGAREGRAGCVDPQGHDVPCCSWQPDPWVAPYAALATVTLLWTVFLVGQLRVFVISGTIAQWYFSPPGINATKGTTLRSIRHGLGPQFGTASFASAVLTVIQMARSALQESQNQEGGGNFLFAIMACCLQCIWSLIEYLTKFATVRAAITGEAFLDAGRSVTELLARNFLKAYGVWWFPPLALQLAAFILSAVWGAMVFLGAWLAWRAEPAGTREAAVLGGAAFVVAWIVQAFFAAVMLDVVDAIFICYAMDRDAQAVTNLAVHEVFAEVPVGIAVQQPGGEYAYGAAPPPQRQQYVPPGQQQQPGGYQAPVHQAPAMF